MYYCITHGQIPTNWCEDCQQEVSCECSDITSTRFKDLIYDCEEGERTVTIYLDHCDICGNIFGVRVK